MKIASRFAFGDFFGSSAISTGSPVEKSDTVTELAGYGGLRREVSYGDRSRVDILLENGDSSCYVEVKNVTLVDGEGRYAFPDAVTVRGQKHLRELTAMVAQGHRAAMLFVIQRSDGSIFVPADTIDPDYGEALRGAVASGVEALAYRADVDPDGIALAEPVEIDLSRSPGTKA